MRARPLSSLNLLRAFEAAARLGSFKQAADELCITASAVSQQVKTLEEQLNVLLFDRQPRGISLTAAGQRYATDILPHLAAISEATARVQQAQERRLLRVTMMPPLASRIVLPRLADFQNRHPGIELRVDTSVRDQDLQQRQTDLAIRYGMPPWPGCAHEKLADLFIQAICPPAVAAAFDLLARPLNLVRAPLVHMTERPDSWPRFFAQLGLGTPTPAAEFFVNDYPAAIEAAESLGAALAVLPLEKVLIDSGRVTAIGPQLGPLPEAMHAVMLTEKQDDPAIRAFLGWLREQLSAL
ncbi:MAG: LysR substrate-binding domain-containing protein [bacterium]|nr:LysR substrate-binding domain-containing protein [bacterium]